MITAKSHHNWRLDGDNDDILALFAYFHRGESAAIAGDIGVSLDTLKWRFGNIKACATGRGLGNVAKSTRRVYAKFAGNLEALSERVAQIRAKSER